MTRFFLLLLFPLFLHASQAATKDDMVAIKEQIQILSHQIDKRFEQIDKRFEQVDKRFEQVDRRFDAITDFMLWGFGILFGGMGLMIGFVLWDRRTAVAPVRREIEELKEREKLLETLLKNFARNNRDFGDIAKANGFRFDLG